MLSVCVSVFGGLMCSCVVFCVCVSVFRRPSVWACVCFSCVWVMRPVMLWLYVVVLLCVHTPRACVYLCLCTCIHFYVSTICSCVGVVCVGVCTGDTDMLFCVSASVCSYS